MFGRVAVFTAQGSILALIAFAWLSGPLRAPILGAGNTAVAANAEIPFRARFERKEYHLSLAWAEMELVQGLDDPDAVAQGAERLIAHARAALAEGPASGYAWLALAWGEHLAGRDGSAREALQASWRWAPDSRNLAYPRTVLASRWWPELGPESRGRILGEMHRAMVMGGQSFEDYVATAPRYAAIWRMARVLNFEKVRNRRAEQQGS